MRQNDFRGATLKEAISKATAFYKTTERKENRFCTRLKEQYERELRRLDRLQDEIGTIRGEIDDLKSKVEREQITSLILSLSVASQAVVRWRGILNIILRLRLDREAVNAFLRNGPTAAAAATAAIAALAASEDIEEIKKLNRRLENLKAQTDASVKYLEDLATSYVNGNCHLSNNQS